MRSLAISFLQKALTLFVVITLTFFLMKALPGDPFNQEKALPKEIYNALRQHYGLDAPMSEQYLRYLKQSLTLDFGPSFRYKDRTVNQIIWEGFPVSATIGLEVLFFALAVGISLGSWAALQKQMWPDQLVLGGTTLSMALPGFILAALLQYLLALKLGWFPVARWGTLSHTFLPALALAVIPAAFIARLVRSSLLEVYRQDYIRTARIKGISERRILWGHALRNALLPVLSYIGPLAANIIVGSFAVETIFALPGLGQWFVTSVLNRDYTVIMGLTVFFSLILLAFLSLTEAAALLLDPRLRKKEEVV